MARRVLAVVVVVLWCVAAALPPATAQGTGAPGVIASAPSALPKTLPLKREEASVSAGSPALVAAGVLVVIAAAGLLALRRGAPGALQRWKAGRADPGGSFVRLSSQSLTPHASVHVVRWSGEELLLACTAQQVTVLARKPAHPPQGGAA